MQHAAETPVPHRSGRYIGRVLLLMALAWTGVVVLGLLFLGPDFPPAGCWRLVGASPECMEQLAAINDQIWRTQTLPRILVGVGGYAVIALIGAAAWARDRKRNPA